jgi:hypothetical protein
MIGRPDASAIALKWAMTISGRERDPRPSGLGGNTSRQDEPAALGRARDARRLQAAVGVDAVHDRQPRADLVHRDLEDLLLLLERARGDLGRVRVDGDRRQPAHGGDIAQVLAIGLLVDGEVGVKRQQAGGDDALGFE